MVILLQRAINEAKSAKDTKLAYKLQLMQKDIIHKLKSEWN